MRIGSPSPQTRVMLIAVSAISLSVLPVFLVGSLAVQIRASLGFGEAGLGAALTAYFGTAGLLARRGARLTRRLGAPASIIVGSIGTALALLLIATAARSFALLFGFLVLAGVARTVTDPGTALLFAEHIDTSKQGLAFGVRDAAIPASTFLAGLAVPAVALTIGWRWAFAMSPLLLGLVLYLRPRGAAEASRTAADPSGRVAPSAPMYLIAAGAGFGIAAATALGTFIVDYAVSAGLSGGSAGLLLSLASVIGIGFRVGAGMFADRGRRDSLATIAVMLVTGAGGLALLAASGSGLAIALGTLTGVTVGWGWAGLLFLSLVRANPDTPSVSAGIALAGLSIGGALGPLLFGLVVAAAGYRAAWAIGATSMLVAAGMVLAGRSRLARGTAKRAKA